MSMTLIPGHTLDFDEWVLYLVMDPYAVDWASEPVDAVRRFERFFKTSGDLPARFSPEDINTMFWCLLGELGALQILFDAAVPLGDRLDCIGAIESVFSGLFQRQCEPVLSHPRRDAEVPICALNSACYMWWDLFPTWGQPRELGARETDAALIAVQAATLEISHVACQESALHGLGHWHLNYPETVEPIIDRFLSVGDDLLMPELRSYAQSARCGCVN